MQQHNSVVALTTLGRRPIVGVVILRRLVGLSLIVAFAALAPAAHASPPDQSWITGLYDNADFDDIVLFITDDLGAIPPSTVPSLRPVSSVIGLVALSDSEPQRRCPQSSDPTRAPPLA